MVEVRDVGLRESVTPRAADISDRLRAAKDAPGADPDQLAEWALAIDYTLAWGVDLTAEEYAEWKAKLA